MTNAFCKKLPMALIGLATVLAVPSTAHADAYNFSFSGGGLSASGVIFTSNATVPGVPGAQQVTGINGTFSDSNQGISNAAITGVQTTSLPTNINSDGTFVPPGAQSAVNAFSFDNLFYPAGNSPAVCPPPGPGDPEQPYPFGGGLLDIYGLLFDVTGGYSVDLWSNGDFAGGPITYGAGDALNGTVLTEIGEPGEPGGYVNVSASPVPEPGSLALMGTGVLGIAGMVRRRLSA